MVSGSSGYGWTGHVRGQDWKGRATGRLGIGVHGHLRGVALRKTVYVGLWVDLGIVRDRTGRGGPLGLGGKDLHLFVLTQLRGRRT